MPSASLRIAQRLLCWLAALGMLLALVACNHDDDDDASAAPSITVQPIASSATIGQSATFSVEAGGADLTYQWLRDGVEIAGATASSYTTPPLTAADHGAVFAVRVSNGAGSITSVAGTLTVDSAVTPTIGAQPADTSVVIGAPARFAVVASGTAPLFYQWHRNGSPIGGATDATYTLPAAAPGDSGALFTVTVSNTAGSIDSDIAALTVVAAATPPRIRLQPGNATVAVGESAKFEVLVLGVEPITYQWQRNGVDIPGATAASYTTAPVAAADNGTRFGVVASNPAGSVTSSQATLTVDVIVAPALATQPRSLTVVDGFAATFGVTATGSSPMSYQWLRNGVAIPAATGSNFTAGGVAPADDGAQFSVTVSNAAGSVTSDAATLTVVPATPTVVAGPIAQTVTSPAAATFTVLAKGSPPLAYQWQRNGVDIGGATAPSYTTPATSAADDGSGYSVRVSNAAGSVVSDAVALTVLAGGIAPTVLAQPQDLSVTEGSPASFSAAVDGSGPLSYQWRRNGVDIAGANGTSYTLPAAAAADDGAVFTLVASNAAGTVTSNPARLGVSAATAFPQGTITLVVPAAAGGPLDKLARDLRDALVSEQRWTIVVSNTGGAGGRLGMERVAAAAPDGYTLLVGYIDALATLPTLYRSLTVDPLTDLEHLGLVVESPLLLAGALGLPAGNYGTLSPWLDGRPAGAVRFADAGLGSVSYLCRLLFASLDGTSFSRIPYRGTAPATVDLIGGVVDLYCDRDAFLAPHVAGNKIRGYGITSSSRSVMPALSGIPTLGESGLPGFEFSEWVGLHAPRGTPADVLAKLNAALRTALANPEFVNRATSGGARVSDGAKVTPSAHKQLLQAETDRWRPLLQAAGEYAD